MRSAPGSRRAHRPSSGSSGVLANNILIISILGFLVLASSTTVAVAKQQQCRCEDESFSMISMHKHGVTVDEETGYYVVDGVLILPYGSEECSGSGGMEYAWEGFSNMFHNEDGDGGRRRRRRSLLRRGMDYALQGQRKLWHGELLCYAIQLNAHYNTLYKRSPTWSRTPFQEAAQLLTYYVC